MLVVALVLTIPSTALVMLPVLPVAALHDTPIVALNYDEGETVGWPTYVDQIARVVRGLPADQRRSVAILADNYGEAGAVDEFGPRLGLPRASSGEDGDWYWGPPAEGASTFVVVGMRRASLRRLFSTCHTVGHLDNDVGVSDQEQGVPLSVCTGRRSPWTRTWRGLLVLG